MAALAKKMGVPSHPDRAPWFRELSSDFLEQTSRTYALSTERNFPRNQTALWLKKIEYLSKVPEFAARRKTCAKPGKFEDAVML